MATSSDSNPRLTWPFIIAIISLVLCVPTIILIAKSYQTSERHVQVNHEVCINSNVLDPNYLKTKEGQTFLQVRQEDAQERYCMRDANALTSFLLSYGGSLQTSRADTPRISNGIGNNKDKPSNSFSVHVPLISSIPLTKPDIAPQFDNTSKYPLHLDVENIGVTGEVADNFVVMSTGIIIKYTGMYHVYSNVLFHLESAVKCPEYATQTWRHDVLKTSPNDRQKSGIILTSLYICCDGCTREKETSYTGGIFLLEAGDHLHVEVSALGLTRFERAASYMGLFMLGDSV